MDKQQGLLQSKVTLELIMGDAGDFTTGCMWHRATAAVRATAVSHQTQLECAGSTLQNGITPYATWALQELALDLVYTGEPRALLRSLHRPALPSAMREERAGQARGTLNSGRDEDHHQFADLASVVVDADVLHLGSPELRPASIWRSIIR